MDPLLTDEQLQTLAESEGHDWATLSNADKAFFRELKEKAFKKAHEQEELVSGKPYQPLPSVLRAPKGEDFNLSWFDFQTKFLCYPNLARDEVARRAKAWKRKNRYPNPPKASETLELTQAEVKDIFFYSDGELYYKNPVSKKTRRGDLVAPPSEDTSKPRRVRVKYKEYPLSHLVFLYHQGYLPRRIKHLDDDKRNVSIENLIEV